MFSNFWVIVMKCDKWSWKTFSYTRTDRSLMCLKFCIWAGDVTGAVNVKIQSW